MANLCDGQKIAKPARARALMASANKYIVFGIDSSANVLKSIFQGHFRSRRALVERQAKVLLRTSTMLSSISKVFS